MATDIRNDYTVTTNKLVVDCDFSAFSSRYTIVSYYAIRKDYRNLAYEQLATVPCLSVTGIRARWTEHFSVRFFVMTHKGKEQEILNSLRQYDNIRCQIDTLEDYSQTLQERIISSLAINSLGMARKDRMMYSNGCLLLCDDKNFLVPPSRKELVCLKIEVNEYMILTAKTTSFSHPRTLDELKRHSSCVFQTAKDVDGTLWEGNALKPVVVRNYHERDINLSDYFIQKKRFTSNHNLVNYWPYNTENHIHGKLFAISQVMASVNEKYAGVLTISFKDNTVCRYDEYKSKDDMLELLCQYMNGRTIVIEDPFKTPTSQQMVTQMIDEMQSVTGSGVNFTTKPTVNAMVIKICEPKDSESTQQHYTQSLQRFNYDRFALQHVILKENAISKSEARRILLELMVKDCLVQNRMPAPMVKLVKDWKFFRYKRYEGGVLGANMTIANDGSIDLQDFGFSEMSEDFESFIKEELHYTHPERIAGCRDYMALERNGNTYLIIDTEEVPVLDAQAIEEAYGKIFNEKEPLAMFKRKAVAHKYLGGFIGMHLWKSEGLDDEPDAAYSYIAGTNRDNMQIMKSTKMEKLPRARRIFVLNAKLPDYIESDVMCIIDMLKLGLGRWNEIMTYPYPFKFMLEFLDNLTEQSFSKHWNEI